MDAFAFDQAENPPRTHGLNRHAIDTEYTLESWLHSNEEVILEEPLLVFGRQFGLDTGIPDLLALDQWGNVVVVELKKGQSGSGSASEETILSQPQNYAQSLSTYGYEALEEVYTEYKSKLRDGAWDVDDAAIIADSLIDAHEVVFGGGVDKSDINENQRMVILAEEITSRTESNTRYLLEQGLNVQCVEVQWFGFPEEAPVDENASLLVSSTVVDYPLSRVRPERSSVDFSKITEAIRDQVAPRVRDREGITEVRATPTKVKVESAYPEGLRYEAYVPGNEGGREAEVRVNAGNVADEDVEQARAVFSDQLNADAPHDVADDIVMAIVSQPEPILIGEQDIEGMEEVVAELVFLIDSFQSSLVEGFGETGDANRHID